VTVVVIDDDLSVRRSLTRLLAAAGYEVISCSSAEEFLAMSSVPRPACLVTDVRMPGMTGLDLLDVLRTRGPSLPMILISGDADANAMAHARAAGAVGFLLKPFASEDLLSALVEAFDRERAELARETPVELR
jgi:two-component system, LuxR family, response regulator FixJ